MRRFVSNSELANDVAAVDSLFLKADTVLMVLLSELQL